MQFLEALRATCRNGPSKIRIITLDSTRRDLLQNANTLVKTQGMELNCSRVPKYGPGRRDIHDRRLTFVMEGQRTTVILTGGIDRYMDNRKECAVIIGKTESLGK